MCGNKLKLWKTKPIWARAAAISCSLRRSRFPFAAMR